MSDVKIMDLVAILLKDAAKHFPTLTITSEITTIPDMTVLRITHHKAINNEHPWMAIVALTKLWLSNDNEKSVKPASKPIFVLFEYESIINQAVDLGLFQLKDFAVVTE